MANGKYEVKVLPPETTFAIKDGRVPIEVYRLHFEITDVGRYYVDVPKEGFTTEKGSEAIQAEARKIIDLMPK